MVLQVRGRKLDSVPSSLTEFFESNPEVGVANELLAAMEHTFMWRDQVESRQCNVGCQTPEKKKGKEKNGSFVDLGHICKANDDVNGDDTELMSSP